MGFARYAGCQPDELADAIGQLSALEAAVQHERLRLVAAYDAKEAWRADGALSMEDWLVARLSIARQTAIEWVRVARAMSSCPATVSAFADGRLSWDQLRPATRLAVHDGDELVAEAAPAMSVAQLDRAARLAERVAESTERERHARRSLRAWWDRRNGMLRLAGAIPAEEGERVLTAIDRIANAAPQPDPTTGLYAPLDVRRAEALVELATARLAADADPDRATVVLHADLDALTGGGGSLELGSGITVSTEVARRLCCDSRLQAVATRAGVPVAVGTTARTVPPWLMRLVKRRDGSCIFPGCGRTLFLQGHHRRHWSDGGPTTLDNVDPLCTRHHPLVHEGGWTYRRQPDGRVVFTRPDGRPLETGPPPIDVAVRDRYLDLPAAS